MCGSPTSSAQPQSEPSYLIEKIWKTVDGYWFDTSLAYSLSSYVANWALGREIYYFTSLYEISLVASMGRVTAVGLIAHEIRPEQQPAHPARRQRIWVAGLGMIATFSLPWFV